MKTEARHIASIIIGLAIISLDAIFFFGTAWFIPLIVIGITLGWSQYWIDFFVELQRQKNLEARFPDFVRNLVGAIKSGMPVSRAIIYVASTDYGDLSPYVKKLANQVEWAIPVHKAFKTFGSDTKNDVIKRAIATVIEAEQAGGNIEDVLETITKSVIEIKKIKQRRRASIHSQAIQSYIIFFVFLVIMIVVQNLVVPYVASMEETTAGADEIAIVQAPIGSLTEDVQFDFSSAESFISSLGQWFVSLRGVFLMIALIQGAFTGLVIGKLSEGEIYPGIKHSLILMTLAFFVITLAQGV